MKALLIRHATATHQTPSAPLSDAGHAEADALVPVLRGLQAGPLFASPFLRAQETIAPFAAASGQTVTVLDDLRERLLSREPLPDWQDHIRRSFDDPAYAVPRGESHDALCRRAGLALTEIAARNGNLPAFVTHGGLTAALLHQADPTFGFEGWRTLRNPDLFSVTVADGRISTFERIALEPMT